MIYIFVYVSDSESVIAVGSFRSVELFRSKHGIDVHISYRKLKTFELQFINFVYVKITVSSIYLCDAFRLFAIKCDTLKCVAM